MKHVIHRVRRASSRLLGIPAKLTSHRHSKQVFTDFAKKRGLLYFDDFNANQDDSHVVRGITLGISSGDAHHVFGSHDGYDIVCVQRQGERDINHEWIVMAFDLHTAVNLPHILIGKKSEAQPLFESLLGIHRDLQIHEFTQPEVHSKKFIKHFISYTPPAHAQLVEHIISPELTNAVVDHIHNIVIEIEGEVVYLTVDKPSLSVEYLDKMMHYGILFAKHIDEKMGAA